MAACHDPHRCYSRLTGGGPGQVMDYPARALARLRILCPRCPSYRCCAARALLREARLTPPACRKKFLFFLGKRLTGFGFWCILPIVSTKTAR